ncbi:pre-mRNA-splicing factor 38B-like [Diorhabda carinulata]|uniref:pre-mRNA-splicing factor 38B-like n=1 Tax=Diorhabda carinulata TaxID=1163345 RepID=UPI0025A2A47A|nr:pre-mRNA-splicing factor 38B-like [Diorhabda carinulata]
MLPFKKSTSKTVIILLIFFISTCFGFLENLNRDYQSRRSFRRSRVSADREFREELPLRRDNSRRVNEKDVIYENLYDRRSFRTGTDRQFRNQDRDRVSNIQDRHLVERSDNRVTDHNRSQLDRSRSLIQNDRRTNGFDRNIRRERDRNLEIRNGNERKISTGKTVEPERFSRDIRERRNDARQSRNLASRISYREGSLEERRRHRVGVESTQLTRARVVRYRRNVENRQCDLNRKETQRSGGTKYVPMVIRESRVRDGERHSRQYRYGTLNENRNPSVNRDDSRRTRTRNIYRNDYVARDRVLNGPISTHSSRNDVYRAASSRRDSARQVSNARINSRNTENDSSSSRRFVPVRSNQRATRQSIDQSRSVQSVDRRSVPVVEYLPNENLVRKLKFDVLANVIQVILGVYLIGQIFAHSSKKKLFGYQSVLPSWYSVKDKLD